MPRVGPRRPLVALRLSVEGIEYAKERARLEGVLLPSGEPNVSEMLRIMFSFASRNMPKGWRP